MTFRVGQRVVTIVDWQAREFAVPKQGEVYTVRALCVGPGSGDPGLHLVELPVCCNGWNAAFFRPVVSHKTDISVFIKMLTDRRARV